MTMSSKKENEDVDSEIDVCDDDGDDHMPESNHATSGCASDTPTAFRTSGGSQQRTSDGVTLQVISTQGTQQKMLSGGCQQENSSVSPSGHIVLHRSGISQRHRTCSATHVFNSRLEQYLTTSQQHRNVPGLVVSKEVVKTRTLLLILDSDSDHEGAELCDKPPDLSQRNRNGEKASLQMCKDEDKDSAHPQEMQIDSEERDCTNRQSNENGLESSSVEERMSSGKSKVGSSGRKRMAGGAEDAEKTRLLGISDRTIVPGKEGCSAGEITESISLEVHEGDEDSGLLQEEVGSEDVSDRMENGKQTEVEEQASIEFSPHNTALVTESNDQPAQKSHSHVTEVPHIVLGTVDRIQREREKSPSRHMTRSNLLKEHAEQRRQKRTAGQKRSAPTSDPSVMVFPPAIKVMKLSNNPHKKSDSGPKKMEIALVEEKENTVEPMPFLLKQTASTCTLNSEDKHLQQPMKPTPQSAVPSFAIVTPTRTSSTQQLQQPVRSILLSPAPKNTTPVITVAPTRTTVQEVQHPQHPVKSLLHTILPSTAKVTGTVAPTNTPDVQHPVRSSLQTAVPSTALVTVATSADTPIVQPSIISSVHTVVPSTATVTVALTSSQNAKVQHQVRSLLHTDMQNTAIVTVVSSTSSSCVQHPVRSLLHTAVPSSARVTNRPSVALASSPDVQLTVKPMLHTDESRTARATISPTITTNAQQVNQQVRPTLHTDELTTATATIKPTSTTNVQRVTQTVRPTLHADELRTARATIFPTTNAQRVHQPVRPTLCTDEPDISKGRTYASSSCRAMHKQLKQPVRPVLFVKSSTDGVTFAANLNSLQMKPHSDWAQNTSIQYPRTLQETYVTPSQNAEFGGTSSNQTQVQCKAFEQKDQSHCPVKWYMQYDGTGSGNDDDYVDVGIDYDDDVDVSADSHTAQISHTGSAKSGGNEKCEERRSHKVFPTKSAWNLSMLQHSVGASPHATLNKGKCLKKTKKTHKSPTKSAWDLTMLQHSVGTTVGATSAHTTLNKGKPLKKTKKKHKVPSQGYDKELSAIQLATMPSDPGAMQSSSFENGVPVPVDIPQSQASHEGERRTCSFSRDTDSRISSDTVPFEPLETIEGTGLVLFPLEARTLQIEEFQEHLQMKNMSKSLQLFLLKMQDSKLAVCKMCHNSIKTNPVINWGNTELSVTNVNGILMVGVPALVKTPFITPHIYEHPLMNLKLFPAVWNPDVIWNNKNIVGVSFVFVLLVIEDVISKEILPSTTKVRLQKAADAYVLLSGDDCKRQHHSVGGHSKYSCSDITYGMLKTLYIQKQSQGQHSLSETRQHALCSQTGHGSWNYKRCSVMELELKMALSSLWREGSMSEKDQNIKFIKSFQLMYPCCPCDELSEFDVVERSWWRKVGDHSEQQSDHDNVNQMTIDNLGVVRFMGCNVFCFLKNGCIFISVMELAKRELLPSNYCMTTFDSLPQLLADTDVRQMTATEQAFLEQFFEPISTDLKMELEKYLFTPYGLKCIYQKLRTKNFDYDHHFKALYYLMCLGHQCAWSIQVTPPTTQLHKSPEGEEDHTNEQPAAMIVSKSEGPEAQNGPPVKDMPAGTVTYYDGGGGTCPTVKRVNESLNEALQRTLVLFGIEHVATPFCSCPIKATQTHKYRFLRFGNTELSQVTPMLFADTLLHCWKRENGLFVSLAELVQKAVQVPMSQELFGSFLTGIEEAFLTTLPPSILQGPDKRKLINLKNLHSLIQSSQSGICWNKWMDCKFRIKLWSHSCPKEEEMECIHPSDALQPVRSPSPDLSIECPKEPLSSNGVIYVDLDEEDDVAASSDQASRSAQTKVRNQGVSKTSADTRQGSRLPSTHATQQVCTSGSDNSIFQASGFVLNDVEEQIYLPVKISDTICYIPVSNSHKIADSVVKKSEGDSEISPTRLLLMQEMSQSKKSTTFTVIMTELQTAVWNKGISQMQFKRACPCPDHKPNLFPSYSFLQTTYIRGHIFVVLKHVAQAIINGKQVICFFEGTIPFFSLLDLKCAGLIHSTGIAHVLSHPSRRWLQITDRDHRKMLPPEEELVMAKNSYQYHVEEENGNHLISIKLLQALLIHKSSSIHGSIYVHQMGHLCSVPGTPIHKVQQADNVVMLAQTGWSRAFQWFRDLQAKEKEEAELRTTRQPLPPSACSQARAKMYRDRKLSSKNTNGPTHQSEKDAICFVRVVPYSPDSDPEEQQGLQFLSVIPMDWQQVSVKQEPSGEGHCSMLNRPIKVGRAGMFHAAGLEQGMSEVKKEPGLQCTCDNADIAPLSDLSHCFAHIAFNPGNVLPKVCQLTATPGGHIMIKEAVANNHLEGFLLDPFSREVKVNPDEDTVRQIVDMGREQSSVVLTGVLRCGGGQYVCMRWGGHLYLNWAEVVQEMEAADRQATFRQAQHLHAFLYTPPAFVERHLNHCFGKDLYSLGTAPWVCVNTLVAIYHQGSGIMPREKLLKRFVDLTPDSYYLSMFLVIGQ